MSATIQEQVDDIDKKGLCSTLYTFTKVLRVDHGLKCPLIKFVRALGQGQKIMHGVRLGRVLR